MSAYSLSVIVIAIIVVFPSAASAVSNLMGEPGFTSIELTWSIPLETITGYFIEYQVNGIPTSTTSRDLRPSFVISSLNPGAVVSGISVRALTTSGQGEAASYFAGDSYTFTST